MYLCWLLVVLVACGLSKKWLVLSRDQVLSLPPLQTTQQFLLSFSSIRLQESRLKSLHIAVQRLRASLWNRCHQIRSRGSQYKFLINKIGLRCISSRFLWFFSNFASGTAMSHTILVTVYTPNPVDRLLKKRCTHFNRTKYRILHLEYQEALKWTKFIQNIFFGKLDDFYMSASIWMVQKNHEFNRMALVVVFGFSCFRNPHNLASIPVSSPP